MEIIEIHWKAAGRNPMSLKVEVASAPCLRRMEVGPHITLGGGGGIPQRIENRWFESTANPWNATYIQISSKNELNSLDNEETSDNPWK